jgi:hypothetical protein
MKTNFRNAVPQYDFWVPIDSLTKNRSDRMNQSRQWLGDTYRGVGPSVDAISLKPGTKPGTILI